MKLRKPSILVVNWVPYCLSFCLSPSTAAPHIFTAPDCTTSVTSRKPRGINAKFQHFVLRFNKLFLLCYTTMGWEEAQWQGDFLDNSKMMFFFKFLMLCLGQSIWHKVRCYWEHVEEHIVNFGSILRTHRELDENTLGTRKSKLSTAFPCTVRKRNFLGHTGFQPHAPKGSLSFLV
jgi:hypothetical protein